MNQLLALFRLDLRLFFQDRRSVVLLFLVPIGIASFMGTLTSNMGKPSERGGLGLVVVDQDRSALSTGLVSALRSDVNFQVTETNEAVAREWVLSGRRPVALVVPEGFGANALFGLFNTNRKPVITVLFDPSRSMERQMVEGLLVPKVFQALAENSLTVESLRSLVREGIIRIEATPPDPSWDRATVRKLMDQTDTWLAEQTNSRSFLRRRASSESAGELGIPLPYTVRAEALVKGQASYNSYAHSFAGMGVQFVLMAMIDLAVGLLRDRESGVFRRLRSLPLSRTTLLAGKAVAWAAIALISLVGCFAFAMLVFGVRVQGSWLGFVGVLLATSLLASTLGLALAAVGRTPAGTRGFAIGFILLMVMIGGAWFPSFVFPKWLQTVSLAVPTRWAMDGMNAMTWRGLGWEAALPSIGVLLAFSALFAAITWKWFKWEA